MRNRFTTSVVSLAILACLAAARPDTATSSPVPDGPYDLSWFTIDGGGGVSAGGNFALSGTAGQPDGGYHAAGMFEFEGGYWSSSPIPGDITDPTASVLRTRIDSARPNPFNPRTAIDFTLSNADANAAIRLEIFDLSGRRVARLLDGKLPPGTHTQVWDGRNDRDRPVQSGVYFGRLTTRDGTHSRKLVLLK